MLILYRFGYRPLKEYKSQTQELQLIYFTVYIPSAEQPQSASLHTNLNSEQFQWVKPSCCVCL